MKMENTDQHKCLPECTLILTGNIYTDFTWTPLLSHNAHINVYGSGGSLF